MARAPLGRQGRDDGALNKLRDQPLSRDWCGANACAGQACLIDACILDACSADACIINTLPE